MTVGTRVDSTSGPITTNDQTGLTIERNTSNAGFSPYKVDSAKLLTAATTLVAGDAGVLVVSGTSALTMVMPTAASCTGAKFIYRALSADAHALTASAETAGVKAFVDGRNTTAGQGAIGSKLALLAAIGATVIIESTGVNFLVTSASGSLTFSGT